MGDKVRLELVQKTESGILVENKEKNVQRGIGYVLQKNEEYPPERYTVLVMFHNELPENYIFEVYEKKINKRIGWIFPLQALLSNRHSFADDVHFLHVILPFLTFAGSALSFVLHFLHTNTFLNNLSCASGNFTIVLFCLHYYFLIHYYPVIYNSAFFYTVF